MLERAGMPSRPTMVVVAAQRVMPGGVREKCCQPRRVDAGRVPVDVGYGGAIRN